MRMPTSAEKPIPTPILNLESPLPPLPSQIRSQAMGFVFGLGSTLLFFASIRGDSGHFGQISVIFVAAVFAAILVHELGHLLAGWIVGFHFNSIQVAWFSLMFEYGKLTFRARREPSAVGYAGIQIDRIYRLRRRLLFFVAGGPTASILSVVVTVVIVNVRDLHQSWLATPAASFAFVSLLASLVSLLPLTRRGHWSDGARLEMLLTSRDKARRWFCLAALANEHRSGKPPRLWNANWAKAAVSIRDNSMDEFSGRWLSYISVSDRKEADGAAAHLERCLELVGLVGEAMRDILTLEAAIFQAWFRDNADNSAKWLSQMKAPKRLPRLMQLRGTIAMDCARKNFESAAINWQQGLALIEKLPPTSLRDSAVASWSEWLTEIRERQAISALPI
jgi:hypothetical protein